MRNREERLLREYIKAVLNEDDTGGMGYIPSGAYGWGMSNYGDSLKKVFVDPFIDAGKVIKASSSKLLLRMKTLAKVAIETILTTMIPFLQSNYTLIFQNEREQLKKIHEKYKKSFEAVDRAFTGDAAFLAFMVSPEAYITAKFVAKSPEMAVGLLETLAVGNENLTKYFADLKNRLKLIDKELKDDVSNYKIGSGGTFVRRGARGPYMTQTGISGSAPVAMEAVAPPGPNPKVELVMQALKQPDVMRQLTETQLAKSMKADAYGVVQRIGHNILGEAQKVLSARTLDDLQRVTGKQVNVAGLEELQGPDRVNLEETVLKQVKASMKEFYTKSLQDEIAKTEEQGVDPNNLYIQALKGTLSKVAAL